MSKKTIEQVKQACRDYMEDDFISMKNPGDMKYLQAGYILEGKHTDEEAIKVWKEQMTADSSSLAY